MVVGPIVHEVPVRLLGPPGFLLQTQGGYSSPAPKYPTRLVLGIFTPHTPSGGEQPPKGVA